MPDGVVVATFIGRIDSLHTCIEAEGEEVEGETQSKTIGDGNLLVKLVEAEFTFGLVLVFTDGPYVTSIDEECAVDFPEQMAAQFDIEIQLNISALVEEVDLSVGSFVGTRAETAYRPSTHGVGTTGKVSFFKRKLVAVAVRIGDTEGCMKGDGVVTVDANAFGKVYITADILGKGYAAEGVLTL